MLSRSFMSTIGQLPSKQHASLATPANRLLSSFIGGHTDDKKVHIIGYPFAGGQGLQGPELSPGWLFR